MNPNHQKRYQNEPYKITKPPSYQENADNIAVGAMFKSSSKQDTRPAGPETLREIREIVPQDGPPLIAIGGITLKNVAIVSNSGADGICVISEVAMATDPARAAKELLGAFRAKKGDNKPKGARSGRHL